MTPHDHHEWPATINTWNDDPHPYVRVKTADEILNKLSGYCAAITTTQAASAD